MGNYNMEKTIKINLARFLYSVKEDKFYKLLNGLIIGRSKGTLTFLQDEAMSSVHAKFTVHHGEVCIEDLKSTNGIRVNNLLIHPSKSHIIALGNLIDIGDQSFILTDQDYKRPTTNFYLDSRKPKEIKFTYFKFYTLQTKLFLGLIIFFIFPPIYFFLKFGLDRYFVIIYYLFYGIFSMINFIYNLKNSYENNSGFIFLITLFLFSVQITLCTLITYVLHFILF